MNQYIYVNNMGNLHRLTAMQYEDFLYQRAHGFAVTAILGLWPRSLIGRVVDVANLTCEDARERPAWLMAPLKQKS